MNWRAFSSMLSRDLLVARRDLIGLVLQTILQPLLLVIVFGQIMVRGGLMSTQYKTTLLPGIVAITILLTGIQAVAMPLMTEFVSTGEIEDRLLAPIRIEWVAIAKVIAGMIQVFAAGAVVLPISWLLMGRGVDLTFQYTGRLIVVVLLTALLSAAGGLIIGCTVIPSHMGVIYSLVLAPMVTFGCVYYSWSALADFPRLIRTVALINPLVYASEGLRGALTPQIPHIPTAVVISVLAALDSLLIVIGLNRFSRKAIG